MSVRWRRGLREQCSGPTRRKHSPSLLSILGGGAPPSICEFPERTRPSPRLTPSPEVRWMKLPRLTGRQTQVPIR